MRRAWFETVIEARRRAKRKLPKSVYKALIAGSQKGLTLRDNVAAFDELGLTPHIVDLPTEPDLTTTIMGQELSMPVFISPTGVQAVHPEAEVAVARAAASRGTAMGLSSFGSHAVEDVVAANPKTFFQSYWVGTKEDMAARAERAQEAGAVGLILTLDWVFADGRDWGSPAIPSAIDFSTMLQHAPEVILGGKFSYLWEYVKRLRLPELSVPNMVADPSEEAPQFFDAYGQWMNSEQPTWSDIAWLRQRWDGPLMIKGITRIEDAKAAVDSGASTISVSNHGGNNFDGTPGSIRVLPEVVDAVGDEVEVIMDGGIRRGYDVVKAIAMGAKAVMIGRAYLWGLAANGQAGVANVLDIISDGIKSGLMGLGATSPSQLRRENLIIPPQFARTAGEAEREN